MGCSGEWRFYTNGVVAINFKMKTKHFIYFLILLWMPCLLNAQTVTLDYFFNHEFRKTKDGGSERFHYTWEDIENSGYAIWGITFRQNGATLNSLEEAPTFSNLKNTDVYIIVDPDTKKETAEPNYINKKHVKAIKKWVKGGGVLVMLANDSANVELKHFNGLAETFGIHFNSDNRSLVNGEQFEMGALQIPADHFIFKTAKKIYLKEICTLRLTGNAKPVLEDKGDVIMAVAKFGKGTVFAVGDPWIYNEYCNGRLPTSFDNDKAADDLAQWLISLTKK